MPQAESAYYVYPIIVKKRDLLMKELKKKNIYSQIHYEIPIHLQTAYKKTNIKDLKITENISKNILSLPFYPGIKKNKLSVFLKLFKKTKFLYSVFFKENIKKNLLFFYKNFFDIIYGSIKRQSSDGFNLIKIKFSKNSIKEYEIFEIDTARIYTDSSQNVAIIKKGVIYKKLSTQLINNHLVDLDKNEIIKTGTRKFIQKKIKGNILSLVQGASAIGNYGHWILDTIPKLIIAKNLRI